MAKLEAKVSKKWGKRESKDEFYSAIVGGALHIWGVKVEWQQTPKTFDRWFNVGDYAEFDSYNTVFFGEITKITANTVSIDTRGLRRGDARFAHFEFVERNWNFYIAEARARNASWMD